MLRYFVSALTLLFVLYGEAFATIYYRSTIACANPTYSIALNNCTGSDGRSFTSIASARAVMVPGDTLQYRAAGSPYDEQLSNGTLSGTAGNPITFENFPGESVTFLYTGSSYPLTLNGNYITFRGMTVDGSSATGNLSNAVFGDNNIIENMFITKNYGAALLVKSASNFIIRNNRLHRSGGFGNCTSGPSSITYGIYLHDTTNVGGVIIENNEIYDNNGAGIHGYPGPLKNVVVRKNVVHDNTWCSVSVGGGIIFFNDGSGGNITSPQVYDNVVYSNGRIHPTWGGTGGNADGIRIHGSDDGSGFVVTNPYIANNVTYNNSRLTAGSRAYGIQMDLNITGAVIVNNLVYGNQDGEINTNGGITTNAFNACIGAGSCGATPVTITNITDCTISTSDFRLKTGTNPCRDSGTTVTTRSAPVGTTDIGAYEQGKFASAAVASTFIEVTMNMMTPGVMPTSGITGFTIANGTSTGSPVVTAASVKAGSNNVIQLTVSGFVTSGTCTVSLGTTNATDSGYIGTTVTGTSQGVNTVSGQAVAGTCNNSSGGAPPSGGLIIQYPLNENTGTTATDSAGGDQSGTLTGSPTWTTPVVEGSGVYFPNDGVDRQIQVPYGNAVNATTQSFTYCIWTKPDAGVTSKIIMGTPNGTNQRNYVGWNTTTWGIGSGSSAFTSGQSEFPVTPTLTRLCVLNDAATDTMKLAVNGVIGTSAAAVKTHAVTSLAGNFSIGCGVTTLVFCGGYTVDEVKIWTSLLTAQEILDDYNSYTPAGGTVACYKQQDTQQQGVYLTSAGSVENRGSPGASASVTDGGSVAFVFQVDCTGSVGSAVAFRPRYSRNSGPYLVVPQTIGADGIAMWGSDTSTELNAGTVGACVSGGLTPNYGPTILDALAIPTVALSQNHSYCIRYIFKFAYGQTNTTYDIQLYQDNGQSLANAPAVIPRVTIINSQASGAQ